MMLILSVVSDFQPLHGSIVHALNKLLDALDFLLECICSFKFKVHNMDTLTFFCSIFQLCTLSDTMLETISPIGNPAVYCTVLQIHIHCNPLPCVRFVSIPCCYKNQILQHANKYITLTIRHTTFTPLHAMKFKQKATHKASSPTSVPC